MSRSRGRDLKIHPTRARVAARYAKQRCHGAINLRGHGVKGKDLEVFQHTKVTLTTFKTRYRITRIQPIRQFCDSHRTNRRDRSGKRAQVQAFEIDNNAGVQQSTTAYRCRHETSEKGSSAPKILSSSSRSRRHCSLLIGGSREKIS